MDMHEALLSKGMAAKTSIPYEILNSPYNCVLLHHSCHVPGTGGDEFQEKAVFQIIEFEGEAKIRKWIEEVKRNSIYAGEVVERNFEIILRKYKRKERLAQSYAEW